MPQLPILTLRVFLSVLPLCPITIGINRRQKKASVSSEPVALPIRSDFRRRTVGMNEKWDDSSSNPLIIKVSLVENPIFFPSYRWQYPAESIELPTAPPRRRLTSKKQAGLFFLS